MAGVFDFEGLERLKNYLTTIKQNHVATMNHYASGSGQGFWHQSSDKAKASLSSTATCASSLVHAGLWTDAKRKWGASSEVAERLLRKPWKSAGLDEDNPFGLSFIVEGVLDVAKGEPYAKEDADKAVITSEIIPKLLGELEKTAGTSVPGSVSIKPYPPSAYLTQLAYRVLSRFDGILSDKVIENVRRWARSEIHRQVALIATHSRIADPLQLGYAITLSANASTDELTSPEEKALTREALRIFFDAQQPDGMWRPSQPLFHYPNVGNAQCFEYELLCQMLNADLLKDELLSYLPKLELTAARLKHTSFDLGDGAVGWASGHHPQIAGPESWSTACVFDFVHSLDRLVAEAVRQALFGELRSIYAAPSRPSTAKRDFAPGFLDATLKVNDESLSLIEVVRDKFVLPIDKAKAAVAYGGRLDEEVPMSAIFFGPPGTSKTDLAKITARYLGWPLLIVDPSYLVQDGLDHVYARSNRLFSMLAIAEQIVVLLDEFDEMGRDRSQTADLLSRFITTSMLPKLVAINKERKIVFLLATNYISRFDAAFSRGGRFDMILQIMPPTAEAKLAKASWKTTLSTALSKLKGKKLADATLALSDLTYLETNQLVRRLASDPALDAFDEFTNARNAGTLHRTHSEPDGKPALSWKTACEQERSYVRLAQ